MSKKAIVVGSALSAMLALGGGNLPATVVKPQKKAPKFLQDDQDYVLKVLERRHKRRARNLKNKANGGFVYYPAVQFKPAADCVSTRGERRRAALGRV